ncbi:serine/threonine-protein kinase [Arthrobacter sp. CAN_C5]|uniref:serine/threonine-protein kinase n=1 Tax=Arthrobacter sp. CAN_C5 TaxID=2760706 RepID=UPI001AE16EEB|nr:serine/threonine-protein kinase [Arthrobacter sp. CAN_C5]MBP2218019.1 serine/threonine-protein kinase [Arthrobacter sp. CAN_C5]
MNLSKIVPGTTIGDRYEVLGYLGGGAGGSVYEAHDRHLDAVVALKLLIPEEEGTAGPWREAQLLQHLKSRFLLDVLNADVEINSDIRFIVTPVMSGGDLEGIAEPHGLRPSKAADLIQQIASGLDRIHRAGMVHRDVKPSNALVGSDEAVLGDLGFCHNLDAEGTAPPNGTFCTVAPEVLGRNGRCSPATDVYSLAATAFYLLSGEYPVDHRISKQAQMDLIVAGSIRELRTVAPHVSRAVGSVVRKSLNPEPTLRHLTATEFGNSLVGAVHGSRDWYRVRHTGHLHCLLGVRQGSKQEVAVCCTQIGNQLIKVGARMVTSGRRVPNKPDICVSPGELTVTLQQLTASL